MSRSLRSTQLCSVPLAVLEHTGLKHGQTLGMLELLRLELAHVAGIVVLGSKTSDVARIGAALDRLHGLLLKVLVVVGLVVDSLGDDLELTAEDHVEGL